MTAEERALSFDCAGERLVGVLHLPRNPGELGVVIVVGGPQTRVGSHRQFVLLARAVSRAGIPVLRFDYRGMGDSSGEARTFEAIDADIRAAVDTLCTETRVERVVVWGLCDAASAALMYAPADPRVAGLILLNPWVHTASGEAKVRLKSYYLGRLRSADFWRKLSGFELDVRASLQSLLGYACAAFRRRRGGAGGSGLDFIERMRRGWEALRVPVFLVLSGSDITADEFRTLCAATPAWRELLDRRVAGRLDLAAANHTFSSQEWRNAVENQTIAWLATLTTGGA